MVKVTLSWSDYDREGLVKTEEVSLDMDTVPRVGESVAIVGICHRRVEEVVHRIAADWSVEIRVRLATHFRG